jgi:hypothetical protein
VDKWSSLFIEGHPLISLLLLAAAFFIFLNILKATFKFALIAAVTGFLLISVFKYSPNDLLKQGEKLASKTSDYVEHSLKPAIYNSLNNQMTGEEFSKYLDPNSLEKWLNVLKNQRSDSEKKEL